MQYTSALFAHEESLMRLNGCPELAAHQKQYEALTRQVLAFQADFEAGRTSMTVQLFYFLSDWLQQHIAGSDQKYAPFLKNKAVA